MPMPQTFIQFSIFLRKLETKLALTCDVLDLQFKEWQLGQLGHRVTTEEDVPVKLPGPSRPGRGARHQTH